jgi:hypothetical protein
MLDLSGRVSLVAITTHPAHRKPTRNAIEIAISRVRFDHLMIVSDDPLALLPKGFDGRTTIRTIGTFEDRRAESVWTCTQQPGMLDFTDTCDHLLGVQYDGYPVNPDAWDDALLDYDYCGAPWGDGVVGNGGFVLTSREFWNRVGRLKLNPDASECYQADVRLCRYQNGLQECHRGRLEAFGVKYAPTELAARFSTQGLYDGHFGFHGRMTLSQVVGLGLDHVSGRLGGRCIAAPCSRSQVESLHGRYDGVYLKGCLEDFDFGELGLLIERAVSHLAPGGVLCAVGSRLLPMMRYMQADGTAEAIFEAHGLERVIVGNGPYGPSHLVNCPIVVGFKSAA